MMDEAFKQLVDKSEITLDFSSVDAINKALIEYTYFFWKAAWLESARQADKRAREECADIARAQASCEGIAQTIEYQIRATIKE